jgi:hypothetical protein
MESTPFLSAERIINTIYTTGGEGACEGYGEEADQRVLSTDGEKAWSSKNIEYSLRQIDDSFYFIDICDPIFCITQQKLHH